MSPSGQESYRLILPWIVSVSVTNAYTIILTLLNLDKHEDILSNISFDLIVAFIFLIGVIISSIAVYEIRLSKHIEQQMLNQSSSSRRGTNEPFQFQPSNGRQQLLAQRVTPFKCADNDDSDEKIINEESLWQHFQWKYFKCQKYILTSKSFN